MVRKTFILLSYNVETVLCTNFCLAQLLLSRRLPIHVPITTMTSQDKDDFVESEVMIHGPKNKELEKLKSTDTDFTL